MIRSLMAVAGLLACLAVAWIWLQSSSEQTPPPSVGATNKSLPGAASAEPQVPQRRRESLSPLEIEKAMERPSKEPPSPITFGGTVNNPDGDPIPGASASLYLHQNNWTEESPLATTFTQKDGRFRLTIEPGGDRDFLLLFEAEGHASELRSSKESDDSLDIVLAWGGTLHGTVTDKETGTSIAGVRVSCARQNTTTDASGRYELSRIPIQSEYESISFRAQGFGSQNVRAFLRDDKPARLDVELAPLRELTIELYDLDTLDPVPEGKVLLHRDRPESVGSLRGQCALPAAEGTSLFAEFRATGYAVTSWHLEVTKKELGTIHFLPMKPIAWVEGTARDHTGVALAETSVSGFETRRFDLEAELLRIRDEFPTPPGYLAIELDQAEETDESGTFRVPILPSREPQKLWASHKDHGGIHAGPVAAETPGQVTRMDITFPERGTIHGRVVFNGEPVAEVMVLCRNAQGEHAGRADTGEDGTYSLKVIPGEITVSVYSRGQPGKFEESHVTVESGETYQVDMIQELDQALATIAGSVRDAEGQPVAEQRIYARSEQGRASYQTTTNEAGQFSLEVSKDHRYHLFVPVSSPEQVSRRNVPAGSTDVEFVIPEHGFLRVQLVDSVTEGPLNPSRFHWALGWRRTGTEAFRSLRPSFDVEGIADLPLPLGPVDVTFRLQRQGYRAHVVENVTVSKTPLDPPLRIALEKAPVTTLRFEDAEGLIEAKTGVNLFFVHHTEQDLIRGPFPEGSDLSNIRLNGQPLWLGDHGLMNQLIHPKLGMSELNGLRPGKHVFVACPETVEFEPSSVEIHDEGPHEFNFRWRRK